MLYLAESLDTHDADRRHSAGRLPMILAALVASGCALDAPQNQEPYDDSEQSSRADERDDAELGVIESGLTQSSQSSAEIFEWKKGQRDVHMRPVSTHLCFLTRLSGEMGWNTSVHVTTSSVDGASVIYDGLPPLPGGGWIYDDSGDTWKLFGYTPADYNSVTAEATCVPNAAFRTDPGMVIWRSGHLRQEFVGPGTRELPLWNGDAIATIAGMAGQFNGSGEFVEIVPSAWNAPTLLRHRSQVSQGSTATESSARSFFIGYPGTPPGTKRKAAVSKRDNTKTRLIRTSSGVCYLTRISGEFNGSEERVKIYPTLDENNVEWWALEVHAGSRNGVSASAECVWYNQSDEDPCVEQQCM